MEPGPVCGIHKNQDLHQVSNRSLEQLLVQCGRNGAPDSDKATEIEAILTARKSVGVIIYDGASIMHHPV